ncbi:MAG: tetratricopeptide repeat protein [Bacteroidales bacterium]|nr:tetratricopeptide repeat protein [Bacteroidales bacterium]
MKYIVLSLICLFGFQSLQSQQLSQMYDEAVKKMEAADYTGAIDGFTKILNQSQYYYDAYLSRGICYEKLKKMNLAIADYDKAIAKNPKFHEAYYQRALFHTNVAKNDQAAIADLSKAIEIKPTYFPAYLQRGDLYFKNENYPQAQADYTKAVELRPNSWETIYKCVFAFLSDDKSDEALAGLSSCIGLKPDFTEAYFQRGKVYEERAEYPRAIEDYSKVIEMGLQTDEVYALRANLYYQLKQYRSAMDDYTLLISQYKKRLPEFYSRRGVCYTSLGDSVNAQKDFTRAISMDKDNYIIYVYRAENFVKRQRLSSALSDYNKAIQLSPKSWDIYYSRAKVYMERKDYQQALDDFSMAIKYNKEKFAEGYFLRGACKDALKDVEGACADLKKAASLHHQEAIQRVSRYCR